MRRLVPAAVAISAVVAGMVAGGAAPAAQAAATAGKWGKAVGVPGLFNLNKGGRAAVTSVSCFTAGNCAADGTYLGPKRGGQGFVADERHGRWGKAIEIPGLATLNVGGDVFAGPIACGSVGNCVTGGAYAYDDTDFRFSSFIATERGGKWGKAVSLNRDGGVYTISCPSGGNCVAAGGATDEIGEYYLIGDAFVIQQHAGTWGSVTRIPGMADLEENGDPELAGSWVNSVACPSVGNCVAGGPFIDKDQKTHGFVANETSGVWGTAIEVPGLAALNTGGDAQVNAVSCVSAGDCVAGGSYASTGNQAFVAVEQNGTWGNAIPVPGLAALNAGNNAQVASMSCSSSGRCAAAGSYRDSSGHRQGFVALEQNGTWSKAIPVPGLRALNKGGTATVNQVSCGKSGNCAAGGSYVDSKHHTQGFVVLERGGVWANAFAVPALMTLNRGGNASVASVSCPATGDCAAGGDYIGRSALHQGFVTEGS